MDKRTILLVEDDPNDEMLTVRALRKNSIVDEIVVVRDGAEALDYLFAEGTHGGRDPKEMPEVVLLDLKMPGMDGLEVLRRMRRDDRTKLLPVIVFTSSREERDIVESYRLGANSYIRKPVDFDEFSETIRNLGLYWFSLNEGPCRRRRN